MSERSKRQKMLCTSADGGQGHAIGACVEALHVVDIGSQRQRYGTMRQLNGTHAVTMVHPIKKGLMNEWRRAWRYMRRAPYEPAPLHAARISLLNTSRPRSERYARRIRPDGRPAQADVPPAGDNLARLWAEPAKHSAPLLGAAPSASARAARKTESMREARRRGDAATRRAGAASGGGRHEGSRTQAERAAHEGKHRGAMAATSSASG